MYDQNTTMAQRYHKKYFYMACSWENNSMLMQKSLVLKKELLHAHKKTVSAHIIAIGSSWLSCFHMKVIICSCESYYVFT